MCFTLSDRLCRQREEISLYTCLCMQIQVRATSFIGLWREYKIGCTRGQLRIISQRHSAENEGYVQRSEHPDWTRWWRPYWAWQGARKYLDLWLFCRLWSCCAWSCCSYCSYEFHFLWCFERQCGLWRILKQAVVCLHNKPVEHSCL